MQHLTITLESPRQPDIVGLIAELDAYHIALYPAESNHLLSVEALAQSDVRFFVARLGSETIGCGALRIDPAGYGEVKRMYVRPQARGLKIGRRMLERLEEEARAHRLICLRLETGVHQHEAIALYKSAGFVERGPFGDYRPDPLGVCMEKTLV